MKTCHRISAAVLTWTLTGLLAPVLLANMAHAASTVLSDVPLAAAKRPNPNLIIAYDDSGSMDFELGTNVSEGAFWWNAKDGRFHGRKSDDCLDFASTSWGGTGSLNFNGAGVYGTQNSICPTDPAGTTYNWIFYTYLFPNGSCGQSNPTVPAAPCDARTYNDGGLVPAAPTQQLAFLHSSDYNRIYYSPGTTYMPWKAYSDGTTAPPCPAGTVASSVCTPANAGTATTMSHPFYGSSTSVSNIALFGNYVTPLASGNPAEGFIFRMQAGMIIPKNTKYRLCNGGCGGWLTASATVNACLVNPTVTSCSNMGMTVASGSPGKIDMTSTPSGYTVTASASNPYDYADMAMTYFPATYWNRSTACGTGSTLVSNLDTGVCAYGPDGQLIKKVTIVSTTTSYTVPNSRTDCTTTSGVTTCTFAQESQNFANWFLYYRKRSLMVNAALGNAFDGLQGLRAGYFVFSNANAPQAALTNLTMWNFDSGVATTNATRLIGSLYKINGNASAGTPTRPAMDYLGQEFRRTDAAAPITNYCQFNAGLVITDGFANKWPDSPAPAAATAYANYDNNTPSTTYPYNKQYNPDTAAPVNTAPYADTISDTMADIAMKLYTDNPRPDMVSVPTTGGVPVDKSDVTPGADRNPKLHVNTYGMILNLTGKIFGNTSTTALINQNNDPYTYPPNWSSLGDVTDKSGSPVAIDELWHATINGRGQMLIASSPEETRDAILTIVANVVSKGGAAAAIAVSNPNPVSGDNFAYSSSYNSGSWSGDINSYTINLTTAELSTASNWNPTPQHLLAARDYTTRVIATYNGTAGTPFQWASLSSTQQTALGAQGVLEFLRGDRTKEGTLYRGRGPRAPYPNNVVSDNVAVLGDIVNAEPIYVAAPKFSYTDNGYTTFKTGAAATRTKMIYQGANDGMLHAFNVANGAEAWAYVPNAMFPNLLNLSSKNAFTHKFYVDGTPVSGDVPFAPGATLITPPATEPAYDWRTILVGSYAKGGRGYYALDVTNPTVASEAALAGKVLWEFPNAATASTDNANLGNSFGRPIIVKTRAAGWVVLVTSGYNNGTNAGDSGGDGKGHLFVLNPINGTKIADLSTGNGSVTTPSGLAYISAWVDHANTDATVETVYGGDLTGSMWRFDLSGPATTDWKVQLLTKLVDASGVAQPVTTEPELGVVSGYRMIYVGTGQYLGQPDVPASTPLPVNASATSTQTMYALKEPKPYPTIAAPLTTALIAPLRSSLVAQTATKNLTAGTVSITTTNAVNLGTKNGWYIDLGNLTTGERIVTNPALGQGVLVFTTNIPSGTDPCLPGGSSWLYNVDYKTGGYIANSNATAGVVGKTFGNVLASRPQFIQLEHAGGSVDAGTGVATGGTAKTYDIVQGSGGGPPPVNEVPQGSTGSGGKRKSWREINVQ